MARLTLWLTIGLWLVLGATVLACSDADTSQVKKDTSEAWAKVRTDGDRLVERIQSNNDADGAKRDLLDQCREAHERIARNDAENATRVVKVCEQIRDTDVRNSDAWKNIKSQLNDLNKRFGG